MNSIGSISTNIQNLSHAVLRSAQIDADKILIEAEEKVFEIKRIARQERELEYQQFIDAARKDSSIIKNKNIAAAEAEAQMAWLVRREALINQVFEKSLAELSTITDREDYPAIILNLIQEAIFQLNEPSAQIHLDPKANQIVTDAQLEQLSVENNVSIERGTVLNDQFGVIAITPDGHRKFENTLQARLLRQQGKLRMGVFKILMGEEQ